MKLSERLNFWTEATNSVVGLGLFRITVGLMAWRQLWGYWREHFVRGFYADYFFLPYFSWLVVPTPGLYLLLLFVGLTSAMLMVLGLQTRITTRLTCLAVTLHFFLDQIWYRHNRYFLVLSLILLSVSPCHRALSLDALKAGWAPIGTIWSSWLIKIQMSLIYLASATSKTFDPSWRGGHVLKGRGMASEWLSFIPTQISAVLNQGIAAQLITSSALITEFGLAALLWNSRTRRFACWVGLCFHGYIEIRFSVLAFSYLTLGTYCIFTDADALTHQLHLDPRRAGHRALQWLVACGDWLGRVQVVTSDEDLSFHDARGYQSAGLIAVLQLLGKIPVLYLLSYPLASLTRIFCRKTTPLPLTSRTAGPSRRAGADWPAIILVGYVIWSAVTSFYQPLSIPEALTRFYDLPWFLAIYCTISAQHHSTMNATIPRGLRSVP